MNDIDRILHKIEGIIEKSTVPEDPIHARDTLKWLLKLKPDADDALKIAAFAHDIERAIEGRKVRRQDYMSYDDFKEAHALNSAGIIAELMSKCKMSEELIDEVFFLVRHHETGGNEKVDVLKNADSISFFHVNLPFYFVRNGVEETKRRFLWGYKKLPDYLKMVTAEFYYQDKELMSLVKIWIEDVD